MPTMARGSQGRIKQITEKESKCRGCCKSFNMMEYAMYHSERFYHFKCFMESVLARYTSFKFVTCSAQIAGLDQVPGAQKEEIIKILLPNVVSRSLRAQLKLTQCMDEMNRDELKMELQKRDIHSRPRISFFVEDRPAQLRKELRRRLKVYLTNNECMKVYGIIVKGYCGQFENDTNLTVPIYLQDIVIKYYPPFLLTK